MIRRLRTPVPVSVLTQPGLLEARERLFSGSDNRLSESNYSETYFNKKFTNHYRNYFALLKIITASKYIQNNREYCSLHHGLSATSQSLAKAFIVLHLNCINYN